MYLKKFYVSGVADKFIYVEPGHVVCFYNIANGNTGLMLDNGKICEVKGNTEKTYLYLRDQKTYLEFIGLFSPADPDSCIQMQHTDFAGYKGKEIQKSLFVNPYYVSSLFELDGEKITVIRTTLGIVLFLQGSIDDISKAFFSFITQKRGAYAAKAGTGKEAGSKVSDKPGQGGIGNNQAGSY